jgi:hypothetical protein
MCSSGVAGFQEHAHVEIQDALATMDLWQQASEGYLELQSGRIVGNIILKPGQFVQGHALKI